MAFGDDEYFIVGIRPVKAVRNAEGGLGLYALDWKTGEFVLAMEYLSRCYFGTMTEVEEVTLEEFNRQVADRRAEIKAKPGP
jgi:hypothetical protein